MKRTISVILLLVIGIYIVHRHRSTPSAEREPDQVVTQPSPPAPQPVAETPPPPPPAAAPTDQVTEPEDAPDDEIDQAADLPVREIIPKLDDLRREVSDNPHTPPLSLVRFSVELYEKEAAAAGSEESAQSLFSELEDCALGSEQRGSNSVQALCLLNAKRLQNAYPSLSRDYDRLETQAEPDAVRLMSDMNL